MASPKNKQDVIRWLNHFNYLESKKPSTKELLAAVKDMQRQYGLLVDGWAGPVTSNAMGLYRCGLPDRKALRVDALSCKWSKKLIRYYHLASFRFPSLTTAQSQEIVRLAATSWTLGSGVKIERTTVKTKADIVVAMGRGKVDDFDGPGNVLAWAEMPCAKKDTQLLMMFDSAEPWSNNTKLQAGVYALAVATHEFGHAWGLEHSSANADLMAPFYNPLIWRPQPGDTQRFKRLYGAGAAEKTEERLQFAVNGTAVLTGTGLALDLTYAPLPKT